MRRPRRGAAGSGRPASNHTDMAIRVLIVDDVGLARQQMRRALGAAPDLEVVGEASNGEEALAQFVELQPDVVLLDVVMPVKDGLAAARQIRALSPRVQLIFVTVMADRETVQAAAALGAAGFVVKPYPVRRLLEALERARRNLAAAPPETRT